MTPQELKLIELAHSLKLLSAKRDRTIKHHADALATINNEIHCVRLDMHALTAAEAQSMKAGA